MRHENRYLFAHVFGFAGLTVDEILNNARAWWDGMHLPYFVPHVWWVMACTALAVGFGIGVGIAVNTLMLRGLL